MTTVVVMPGGFHPFHAGHMSLYNSARRTFPDAEVYVAATNDTSTRPFPFSVKEKLAKLAGVEPGHFVQVKSPFRAEEITSKYDPEKDVVIFVRSEKDEGKPPIPGGVKKDGTPQKLQPLLGATKLEPFGQRVYMAYLPTVEFGPGMTSATQIRAAWPTLNQRRKTALVMSLYPKTQNNPQLANTVVKLLDTAIPAAGTNSQGGSMEESSEKRYHDWQEFEQDKSAQVLEFLHELRPQLFAKYGNEFITNIVNKVCRSAQAQSLTQLTGNVIRALQQGIDENQGWAATFTNEEARAAAGQQGAGMTAGYQRRENQPVDERKKDSDTIPAEYRRDPELYKLRQYAKQHYGQYSDDPEMAMMKLLQRGMEHSEVNDQQHDRKIAALAREIQNVRSELRQQQNEDYVEEKWSEKYKRSINCSNPRGFSQRAHCAGRKK